MRRKQVFLRVILVGLWLVAVSLVIDASLDSDQYFRYGFEEEKPFEYPLGSVFLVLLIMVVELVGLWLVFRPRDGHLSIKPLLIGLAGFGVWFGLCLQLVMHVPGYILIHLLWLLFVLLWLSVCFLVVLTIRASRALGRPHSSE